MRAKKRMETRSKRSKQSAEANPEGPYRAAIDVASLTSEVTKNATNTVLESLRQAGLLPNLAKHSAFCYKQNYWKHHSCRRPLLTLRQSGQRHQVLQLLTLLPQPHLPHPHLANWISQDLFHQGYHCILLFLRKKKKQNGQTNI